MYAVVAAVAVSSEGQGTTKFRVDYALWAQEDLVSQIELAIRLLGYIFLRP